MHVRELFQAALLAGLFAGSAHACSDHSKAASAATVAPKVAKHAAIVSWKPRAWAPSASLRHAAIAPVSAGMRVERDPVDGTLTMPQPDRFQQMLQVEGERTPVSVIRMSNGRVRAQLDENFAEFAVVSIGADGKPRWTCVSGPANADRFLKGAPVQATVRTPAPGTTWEDK